MTGRLRAYGDTGLLIETGDLTTALGLGAALTAAPPVGVVDVVPAARSVLVRIDPARTDVAAIARAIAGVEPLGPDSRDSPLVQIPVQYDGADLAEVGRLTGLGADGVVAAHTAAPWTVAFCGFAPGFGYCTGGDPRLHVPRRNEPRTRVPAGSVALAGEFTAVYPRESPGGWQLIGRTATVVWDLWRDAPALLQPGTRVQFVPAERQAAATPASAPSSQPGRPALEVLATGPLATIQDLGRPGQARIGVGTSGACDRPALRRGNRLAGNVESAAGLEVTLGGLQVRALVRLVVAVTGAPVPVRVDGTPAAMATALTLPAGSQLTLGPPRAGSRTYVAVHGGVDVPAVLGSRSTDVLTGLGPPIVRAGDVLAVGASTQDWALVDVAPGPLIGTGEVALRVVRGPHDDWFDADAVRRLSTDSYTVSAHSNRIGVRLVGTPLVRPEAGELPSEGVLPGAIQVPPSGQPTILLADHPVTGGYPVIGVLLDDDRDLAGQLRAGQSVRFRVVRAARV